MDFEKANLVLLKKIHRQMIHNRNLKMHNDELIRCNLALQNQVQYFELKEKVDKINGLDAAFRFS